MKQYKIYFRLGLVLFFFACSKENQEIKKEHHLELILRKVEGSNKYCYTGVIEVEAIGGLGNVDYVISGGYNFRNSGRFTFLSPSDHIIKAMDDDGCVDTLMVKVPQLASWQDTIDIIPLSIKPVCGQSGGAITIFSFNTNKEDGAKPPLHYTLASSIKEYMADDIHYYSYTIDNLELATVLSKFKDTVFSNLKAGTYYVVAQPKIGGCRSVFEIKLDCK